MFFSLFLLIFTSIRPSCVAQNTSAWTCYLNNTAIKLWVASEVEKQMNAKSFACDCGNGTTGTVIETYTPEGCCTGAGCNCSITTTSTAVTTQISNVTTNEIFDEATNSTKKTTVDYNQETTTTTVVSTTNSAKANKECPDPDCNETTTTTVTSYTGSEQTPFTTVSGAAATTSPPNSCKERYNAGSTTSGIYNITVGGAELQVFCQQEVDGGGWMVFQKRDSGSVDFYLDWDSYKNGFGNLSGEFWVGLDNLHAIVAQRSHELRVDMSNADGEARFAKYGVFLIGDESNNYQLSNVGDYSGDAGDSLSYHLSAGFSTRDQDNDEAESYNCASIYQGAWWYKSCYRSNLNGVYGGTEGRGMVWNTWNSRSLIEETMMMVREL